MWRIACDQCKKQAVWRHWAKCSFPDSMKMSRTESSTLSKAPPLKAQAVSAMNSHDMWKHEIQTSPPTSEWVEWMKCIGIWNETKWKISMITWEKVMVEKKKDCMRWIGVNTCVLTDLQYKLKQSKSSFVICIAKYSNHKSENLVHHFNFCFHFHEK